MTKTISKLGFALVALSIMLAGCKTTTEPEPEPKPDPEELELQAEIEAIQKQIEAASKKLVQTVQGENADLKRIGETKERKMRRVIASAKQQQQQQDADSLHTDITNTINRAAAEEAKSREIQKQTKL